MSVISLNLKSILAEWNPERVSMMANLVCLEVGVS